MKTKREILTENILKEFPNFSLDELDFPRNVEILKVIYESMEDYLKGEEIAEEIKLEKT